jgi:hypothetical protein
MRALKRLLPLILPGAFLLGCSSLTLENVNFGWPVEGVVTVTPAGLVEEVRYGVALNVIPVAAAEFQDSTALRGARLRLLRSTEGFYFLTGPRFRHVYVFAPGPSTLTLAKAIEVSKDGLSDPALNQRTPYVELVDAGGAPRLLTRTEIVEAGK